MGVRTGPHRLHGGRGPAGGTCGERGSGAAANHAVAALREPRAQPCTVAEEYFTVSEKVDALYSQPAQLPADALGPNTARLNREHHRVLGNGYCTRPKTMDCQFENICESCTFFQTSIEFRPTLLAQREDACAKGQTRRAEIFHQLITGLDTTEAS